MALRITPCCHYAECCHTVCHVLFDNMLTVIMLNVVMLSVVAPKNCVPKIVPWVGIKNTLTNFL
jgi:hypothetical protein